MARKLIAKNVPYTDTRIYESCGQCHFYGKIDTYIMGGLRFDGDAGGPKERYSFGCSAEPGKHFKIENPNEVHRECSYLDFGLPDLNLDSLMGQHNQSDGMLTQDELDTLLKDIQ